MVAISEISEFQTICGKVSAFVCATPMTLYCNMCSAYIGVPFKRKDIFWMSQPFHDSLWMQPFDSIDASTFSCLWCQIPWTLRKKTFDAFVNIPISSFSSRGRKRQVLESAPLLHKTFLFITWVLLHLLPFVLVHSVSFGTVLKFGKSWLIVPMRFLYFTEIENVSKIVSQWKIRLLRGFFPHYESNFLLSTVLYIFLVKELLKYYTCKCQQTVSTLLQFMPQ